MANTEIGEVLGEGLVGMLLRYDAQLDHHSHLIGADYKDIGCQRDLKVKIDICFIITSSRLYTAYYVKHNVKHTSCWVLERVMAVKTEVK